MSDELIHITVSDANYPRGEWKFEVENGDTSLSYWEWVEYKYTERDREPPDEDEEW
jgi:hypothetical protein